QNKAHAAPTTRGNGPFACADFRTGTPATFTSVAMTAMEAAAARVSTAALSLRTAGGGKRSSGALCSPSRLLRPNQAVNIRPRRRDLCMAARSQWDGASWSPAKVSESFFRSVISKMEKVYLGKNPTAGAVLDLVRSSDGDNVCYDHFAFRTFGNNKVDGHGIDSMSKFFVDFGYTPRDELRFPAKKLRALWFAPPETELSKGGTGVEGPLPRIFISELIVDELSHQSQAVCPFKWANRTATASTALGGWRGADHASALGAGGLSWAAAATRQQQHHAALPPLQATEAAASSPTNRVPPHNPSPINTPAESVLCKCVLQVQPSLCEKVLSQVWDIWYSLSGID
ncbi:hypothetical protein Taro_002936, partial [Colocasia esculenta]|nr:hypothetical protein [Colocasia esculenta]